MVDEYDEHGSKAGIYILIYTHNSHIVACLAQL